MGRVNPAGGTLPPRGAVQLPDQRLQPSSSAFLRFSTPLLENGVMGWSEVGFVVKTAGI